MSGPSVIRATTSDNKNHLFSPKTILIVKKLGTSSNTEVLISPIKEACQEGSRSEMLRLVDECTITTWTAQRLSTTSISGSPPIRWKMCTRLVSTSSRRASPNSWTDSKLSSTIKRHDHQQPSHLKFIPTVLSNKFYFPRIILLFFLQFTSIWRKINTLGRSIYGIKEWICLGFDL